MRTTTATSRRFLLATACLLTAALPAAAQSTISPTNKYDHAANAGWIDFRTSAADGVRVADTFLSGFAYGANFGYLSLGSTAGPANGHTFANTTATNFGVNLSPTGLLTGYAYAANIGWINFEQTHGQPRINLLTGVFTGHAYSSNIGWIALATPFSILATTTLYRPDTDSDGIPDDWEMLYFGNLTTATATSDKDNDGSSDLAEYQNGTDPNSATSHLRFTAHTWNLDSTWADLTWTTVPTRRYRLEFDSDLLGTWTNSALGTFDPDPGPTTQRLLTPLSATSRRFFRAIAIQPLP